jgi:hypothetical protein
MNRPYRIEKFREIPYGGHIFLMARPIEKDWRYYDNTFLNQGRTEFRPCMLATMLILLQNLNF